MIHNDPLNDPHFTDIISSRPLDKPVKFKRTLSYILLWVLKRTDSEINSSFEHPNLRSPKTYVKLMGTYSQFYAKTFVYRLTYMYAMGITTLLNFLREQIAIKYTVSSNYLDLLSTIIKNVFDCPFGVKILDLQTASERLFLPP